MRVKMARGQRRGGQAGVQATELKVSGQVQRVGYRRLVIRAARKNGISGFVKNERNETVKVVAEGAPAGIRRFISDISIRKEPVLVEGIEEKRLRPTGRYHGFSIRPGTLVDELQEGLGGGQEQLVQLTDEFRDYRKEFRGFSGRTDSNFKELGGRYDAISEKLSTIMAEMAEQTKKTNDLLESFKAESKASGDRLDESLRLLREAVAKMPSQGPQPSGSP